ncbi:hypothetical protein BCR37DRAFT_379998 [Protomyces lactucae-debilis]|uniref:Uncharacterized protein n=1 Tax=Protomyces lactucae-debilis TaxID=2754530 RepID=A0A1Y2FFL6_PROLT|nr:uncharacterized protein BCR37DRAFT_379998 [Protomyces lactucae-debilis]ORY82076.1 hypothetical protein BCR37DRAFT_379998 [Protomyces lactucae-debilis]
MTSTTMPKDMALPAVPAPLYTQGPIMSAHSPATNKQNTTHDDEDKEADVARLRGGCCICTSIDALCDIVTSIVCCPCKALSGCCCC